MLRCVVCFGFGRVQPLAVRVVAPDAVASGSSGGKFAVRAQSQGLRFSEGWSVRSKHTGVLRRLTIRSSRPRIVASATCIRYASTRPPPRHGAA
jgi:hypothetical protein